MKVLLIGHKAKGLGGAIYDQLSSQDEVQVETRSRGSDTPLDLNWEEDRIGEGVRSAIEGLGGLDTLIISSGMGAYYGPLVSGESVRKAFQVNVFGPMAVYRAALKALLRSKGKAVFITSTAARRPGSGGLSIYAATKGAINSWVVSEGRRAAKKGVALCAVAPGFFESPMTAELEPGVRDSVTRNIPFKRFGESDEIAKFTTDLLGQSNWCLAGQIFEVSGGA